MYEMLTGFKVFPEKRVAPLVQKRLANEFDKLNMYKLDLPPRLKKLIRQCLDTNRQKRPENMGYISRELGRIFDSIAHGSPEMVIKHYIETVGDKVNVVFFKPSLKWITIGACASILVTCALLGVTYHEQISSFAEYVSGSLEAAPPAEFGTVQAAVISQSPDTKVTYIPDKAENKAKTIMAKDEFKRRR